jgi:hypothetical protein
MTHVEKANELFDKFYKELDGYGILPPHHMQSMAKNLSIICVEQIINLPVCWYSKELANRDEDCPHSATE